MAIIFNSYKSTQKRMMLQVIIMAHYTHMHVSILIEAQENTLDTLFGRLLLTPVLTSDWVSFFYSDRRSRWKSHTPPRLLICVDYSHRRASQRFLPFARPLLTSGHLQIWSRKQPTQHFGKILSTQRREKKEDIEYRESHYAVINEKIREETSSMNIHVGYFPFMVSVPW